MKLLSYESKRDVKHAENISSKLMPTVIQRRQLSSPVCILSTLKPPMELDSARNQVLRWLKHRI